MTLIDPLLAILCAVGGVTLLHRAWKRRGGAPLVLRGAFLILLGVAPWRASGVAWDMAIALTLLTVTLVALCGVALEGDFKPGRARTRATRDIQPAELPSASGPLWRGLARTLLAGPLAGAAALALATAVALRMPWPLADRVVAAGFILPMAWAIGGVWATSDARLVRVGVILVTITGVAFGAARL